MRAPRAALRALAYAPGSLGKIFGGGGGAGVTLVAGCWWWGTRVHALRRPEQTLMAMRQLHSENAVVRELVDQFEAAEAWLAPMRP